MTYIDTIRWCSFSFIYFFCAQCSSQYRWRQKKKKDDRKREGNSHCKELLLLLFMIFFFFFCVISFDNNNTVVKIIIQGDSFDYIIILIKTLLILKKIYAMNPSVYHNITCNHCSLHFKQK